jgi:hypothetical protein
MPYIESLHRQNYNKSIYQLVDQLSTIDHSNPTKRVDKNVDVGDLNYVISKLIWTLFDKNKRYKTANDIIGVLECVKLEIYRRQIATYEEEKCKANGDL